MENKEIPAYIKNQEKYLYYMELCNSALLGTLTKDWIDAVNEQDMFEDNEYNFYLDLIKLLNIIKFLLDTQANIKQNIFLLIMKV